MFDDKWKKSRKWLHIPTPKEQTQNVHANGKVLSGWQENKMWQGFPICMACLKKCVLFVMCAVVLKTKQTICCWIVMLIDSTCTDSISSIHFMFTLKRQINLCECRLLSISRYHTFDDRWGKKLNQIRVRQTQTENQEKLCNPIYWKFSHEISINNKHRTTQYHLYR